MARYGKKSQDKVERAMHEMKHGELKSGQKREESYKSKTGNCHRFIRSQGRRGKSSPGR